MILFIKDSFENKVVKFENSPSSIELIHYGGGARPIGKGNVISLTGSNGKINLDLTSRPLTIEEAYLAISKLFAKQSNKEEYVTEKDVLAFLDNE